MWDSCCVSASIERSRSFNRAIKSASAADNGLDCLSDQYASAEYRAHLAGVLARQALTMAMQRLQ